MSSEGGGPKKAFDRFKERLLAGSDKRDDEEKQEIEMKERSDASAITFIRANLKASACDSFIQQEPSDSGDEIEHDAHTSPAVDQNPLCECGFPRSDHTAHPPAHTPSIDSFPAEGDAVVSIASLPEPDRPTKVNRIAPQPKALHIQPPERTTNAYGRITFHPAHMVYRKPAKYNRLTSNTNMDVVLELMSRLWHLARKPEMRPDMIISVVGGGERFRLSDSRKKTIFDQGLIKVVKMTNGWIFSQGTNNGVSKAVGDAVRDGQSLQYDENGEITRTIHCIGITPWEIVKRRDMLINKDSGKLQTVHYRVDKFNQRENLYSLNPDHSHFLFVDEVHGARGSSCETFYAQTQKKLCEHFDCRAICVLVDGGFNSFAHIRSTLEAGIHVLICKGTGRFADLLAKAKELYDDMKPRSVDDKPFRSKLKRQIGQNLDFIATAADEDNQIEDEDEDETDGGNKEKEEEKKRGKVVNFEDIVAVILKHHKLLRVFDVDKEAFDMAIMEFLMEQKHGNHAETDRLKLALRWNASTFAASKLFTDPMFTKIKPKRLTEFFESALINNQVEFIRLFIDYGALDISKFLTVSQLRKLYSESLQRSESIHLRLVLKKMKLWTEDGLKTENKAFHLSYIHTIIKKFARLYNDAFYSCDHSKQTASETIINDKKVCEHPFHELFIWAVLLNRKRLALFFWENCFKPLSVAMLGCLLCTGMKNQMRTLSEPIADEFKIMKGELLQLAKKIVDQAYNVDREKAMLMIQLPIKEIGDLDSMAVASIANTPEFFNSACCQQLIGKQWKRGFDASGCKIVVAFLSSLTLIGTPLTLNLIRFDKRNKALDHQLLSNSHNEADRGTTYSSAVNFKIAKSASQRPQRPSIQLHPSSDSDPNHIILDENADAGDVNASSSSGGCIAYTWKQLKKLRTFHTSPVVKFTAHMASYVIYLLLYAAVMLFFYPTAEDYWRVEWPEILLYFWQLTFFCEMYRTVITTPGDCITEQFHDWWQHGAFGTWNRMDVFSISISTIALILRCFSITFPLARLLMLIAMFLYFQRVYKMHFVNSYLGPKVIMLTRMSADLFMFLLVFMVFMLSYSISVQALMEPNTPPYWGIFWDLFQRGIWETFGEPNDEAMKGMVANCSDTEISFRSAQTWDCFMRVYPIPIFLAAYLFFGSILLVNMLIAAFSHIFDEVQANSKVIWRFQMYFLFAEFDDKPLLPPPFIIISHAWRIIVYLYQKYRECHKSSASDRVTINGQKLSEKEVTFIKIFERICRRYVVDNQRSEDLIKIDCSTNEVQDILIEMK